MSVDGNGKVKEQRRHHVRGVDMKTVVYLAMIGIGVVIWAIRTEAKVNLAIRENERVERASEKCYAAIDKKMDNMDRKIDHIYRLMTRTENRWNDKRE